MSYRRLCIPILLLALMPLLLGAETPDDLDEQRTQAAVLLTFGRLPTSAERTLVESQENAPVSQRIEALLTRLQRDATLAKEVRRKAWRDAFGDEPPGASAPSASKSYVVLLREHLKQLASQPARYREVIERAYGRAIGRAPHAGEFTYWSERDTLPYIALVACIEHWAQRNAPGLMSTTGEPSISIHSPHLVALRLAPAVALEVRAAAGLPPAENGGVARKRHVIIPGAASVVAVGGIHFVAVGRD